MRRQNERGHTETFFKGNHLKFRELREIEIENAYIARYPPPSPQPVTFCVSNLCHDTSYSSFQAIMSDCGFKKPAGDGTSERSLVWWSLAISTDDINAAEKRFLNDNRVNADCKPFLHKFTSSPAFKMSSRFGNFRFTFSIRELLENYSTQFCRGQAPQMRNYETVIYKQEVMYTIVVHGPDAQREFENYPLLKDSSNAVCVFQDEKIYWRPEGMSQTHAFRFSFQTMKPYRVPKKLRKFCAWDHVAVAFHVPQGTIFSFNQENLRRHLSLCQGAKPNLSNEEFIKCQFEASPPQ